MDFEPILTTDKRGLKFIDNKSVKNIRLINGSSLNKKKIFISILLNFNCYFSICYFFNKKSQNLFLEWEVTLHFLYVSLV